jgi:pimeloyl-ACP methyl ester carboxylesterase
VAIWAAWPFRFRQQLFSIAVAPFLGRFVIPLSDALVNPRHVPPRIQRQLFAYLIGSVSRRLLLQLRDWILTDAFRSADGATDYRVGLERLNVPALVIGGTHDRLAPADVVRAAYELLGSDDKQLALFGCEYGHRQNYGHGDLLFGEGAPTEVYPRIRQWLEAHATPFVRSVS